MPAVEFEFTGWQDAVNDAMTIDEQMADATVNAVYVTSIQTQDDVQAVMPVDTGWAQQRWGVPQFGGVWEVSNAGLTIEQGSSIEPYEYIEKLNEGSSTQAPAGFLDSAAARAEERLETAIESAVTRLDNR